MSARLDIAIGVGVHCEPDTEFEVTRWTTTGNSPTADPRGRYTVEIKAPDVYGGVVIYVDPDELLRFATTLAVFADQQQQVWADELAPSDRVSA